MFGFPKRGRPEIHVDYRHPDGTPVATAADTIALIDRLTMAALKAGRDYDLAIDLRQALRLPMPGPLVRPSVPVVPGRS